MLGRRVRHLRQIHSGSSKISHETIRRSSFAVPTSRVLKRFLNPVPKVHQHIVFVRKHYRPLIWRYIHVYEVFRHFKIQSAGRIVCIRHRRGVCAKHFVQSFRDFRIIHRTSIDVKKLSICRGSRRCYLILETGQRDPSFTSTEPIVLVLVLLYFYFVYAFLAL